jgi:hypothetical protein
VIPPAPTPLGCDGGQQGRQPLPFVVGELESPVHGALLPHDLHPTQTHQRSKKHALARTGVRSVLRTTLLGYRVDRYTPTDAEVVLWAVVIYGNDGGLVPQALWATSTLRLRWAGDWKLVGTVTAPGPVPVQGQATPSAVSELMDAAERFKEFSYAAAG